MQSLLVMVLLVFISFWPAYGQTSSKIGIVDGEKLFDLYPGVQDAQKKIADAQDDLKNAIEESEKVFTEFEKQKKSEAEKLTKKRELQEKIDLKADDTRKMVESISVKIEKDITDAIKKVALEKGLEVVFDRRAVLVGGSDVTDAVAEILKRKVPLASDTADPLKQAENKKKTN